MLALAAVLALYGAWIVSPQVNDLRRRAALPEFQGTAHLVRLRHCLEEMSRLLTRVRTASMALAVLWVLLRLLRIWI